MINPQYSMRYCIMNGYNDIFEEKTNMFSEHLRDGDVVIIFHNSIKNRIK